MMNRPYSQRFSLAFSLVLLVGLMLVVSACGGEPEPTPTPTRTPKPTMTPTPQVAAQAIDTATPTETPVPLPSDTPTITPVPTETSTPSPTPTSTPDPNLIVPESGSGYSLYTGLQAQDPSVLDRMPVLVKVANQKSVNPQSGLNAADIVVESQVEFSETRYSALYQSQNTDRIGSIRSARLIDVELPAIFDSVLAFSGGVQPVREKLYGQADMENQILEQALNSKSFYRDRDIKVPDNLFADSATFWRVFTNRGWNRPPDPAGKWVFSEAPPEGGSPASSVRIPYPRFKVQWHYDAGQGRYLRTMAGSPHIDKPTSEQLSAANVVILGANHVTTLIIEHGNKPRGQGEKCSNCSIEIQLWGEGPVQILRDGLLYEGKWVRPGRLEPFRFVDAEGNDMPLKPGNSWWQVVSQNMPVTITP